MSESFQVDPSRLGLVSSGGQKLPHSVRGTMEAALGADFSDALVHTGPQADRVGAIAFTVGTEIYFAHGRFQPDTPTGKQLLGHELAHVVQQREGRVRAAPGTVAAVVHDAALEAEAKRWSERAGLQFRLAPAAARTESGRSRVAPCRMGAARIQRYQVVRSPDRAEFLAQEKDLAGNDPGNDFLDEIHSARVTAPKDWGVAIRVSDDREMAIEDSDLTHRQAKCFFATPTLIEKSNRVRQGAVQLAITPETITVPSYKPTPIKLNQVVPQKDSTEELDPDPDERRLQIAAIESSQNCNEIAGQISGLSNLAETELHIDTVLELTHTDRSQFHSAEESARSANLAMKNERPRSWSRPILKSLRHGPQ